MHSITSAPADGKIVVGVDTHKHVHVAVALDLFGGRRGELTISADTSGYAVLAAWTSQPTEPNDAHLLHLVACGRGEADPSRQCNETSMNPQNPIIRVLVGLVAAAVAIRVIFDLLAPVFPYLLAAIVLFDLVQIARWWRDRW